MLHPILRIIIAGILGMIIGMYNKSSYDSPFARLFSIICMAACLLTVTSMEFFKMLDLPWISDPGRISAQIISALGFLGTGLIWIGKDDKVHGLPEATALWLTAILGMLVGAGMNQIAVIGVAFLLIIYYLSNQLAGWKHRK